MPWDTIDLVESVEAALKAETAHRVREQEIYGIDTLETDALIALAEHGLLGAGYGVWPQHPYPGQSRSRCPLVLTPDGQPIESGENTSAPLFADPDAQPPESAYWLEVITARQHRPEGEFDPTYAQTLQQPALRAARRLANPQLFHSGLMMILFTRDHDTVRKDIQRWCTWTTSQDVPVHPPVARGFSIDDRAGHQWVAVVLMPIGRS